MLTAAGEEQAEALARYYGPILRGYSEKTGEVHLFSSPQQRAMQTAAPLGTALGTAVTLRLVLVVVVSV